MAKNKRNPVLAGVLSIFLPGLGQIYGGDVFSGLVFLVLGTSCWCFSGGTMGWVFHIIAAVHAMMLVSADE